MTSSTVQTLGHIRMVKGHLINSENLEYEVGDRIKRPNYK